MKKSIFVITASALIGASILTSCNTSAEKVENAQDKVSEATLDLDKANEEYLVDIENYRKETEAKIAANDQSIAEFNARIENEKNEAKADYKKKIAELEQKNSDIKKKMAEYKAEGKEKWELFKTEFSRDMDELGKAFKDLTVKNH
ncbi:MAG: peptidase M23 [Bacteroidota bacterium]